MVNSSYYASTVFRGVDKTSPVMDKMSRNAMKANQRLQGSFAKVGKAVGGAALNVANYAALGAVGMAGFGVKKAITDYLDFESEMLNVKAITRATTEDYDSMTASALKMAKKSVFTSKEVAQGMKYLGMAGWETKNIIAGMPGILQLAAATQSDLAQTSDMLSDAMTAFRIPAEQAVHVADVFAGTATRTNTNMEQLQEAMKDAAPAAVTFGVDVETTSAMLGVMADSGIKATRAGTAFKNMTMRLANPTKTGAKWLKRLGVEIADQDGNFRNIVDIVEDLKTGLAGLTQEEQSVAEVALFGKNAIAGVSAVLGDQKGKVAELTKAFKENIGVAANMAETQLSGASGAVKKMTSAWDAFSIAAIQKYAPALQGLAEHLTALISGELPDTGKNIQQANIKNLEQGIQGDVIQSPFPTWSDKRFNKEYELYREMMKDLERKKYSKEESFRILEKNQHLFDESAKPLYRDLYNAEEKGKKERIKDLDKRSEKIRYLYNFDTKLKAEDSKSPMQSFVEKVTKQENTLIIKAPKGTTEFVGKIPKNLKLVETF